MDRLGPSGSFGPCAGYPDDPRVGHTPRARASGAPRASPLSTQAPAEAALKHHGDSEGEAAKAQASPAETRPRGEWGAGCGRLGWACAAALRPNRARPRDAHVWPLPPRAHSPAANAPATAPGTPPPPPRQGPPKVPAWSGRPDLPFSGMPSQWSTARAATFAELTAA